MRTLLLVISLFIFASSFAQADKIYLHNGKTVEGSVVRVSESTILFKYINEDAEQTLGKYAVQKITYGKSGRTEAISSKVQVVSKDDWESVVIIEDNAAATGLTKVGEIKGKTSFINYRTAAGSDKKSLEKLKKEAAEQGCGFILITSEKDAGLLGAQKGLGSVQSIKKGIAYKY